MAYFLFGEYVTERELRKILSEWDELALKHLPMHGVVQKLRQRGYSIEVKAIINM